ncbi:VTT domain-containing protein [Arthrobacter sp. MYb213]|uniref:DedA family protein n=1 Tax=Arthrobacter sp. MYb213 TaxID=1848595 RepID=UPI002570D36E|nr:VTT domain-containing protein [Arthrobacter sp. MYb213]
MVTFTFFFIGAMLRGNATYWAGRAVARGVENTRYQKILHGAMYQRAQRFIARWGMLAVPLCFLTIGIQSAVNATAGVSRMPLRRYLPAVTVGALAWALIYTTIGMAVFYAWLSLEWPYLVGGVLLIAVIVILVFRLRQSKSPAAKSGES